MSEDKQKIANELHDTAIQIEGLARTLCSHSLETIACGKFDDATYLAFSYKCLTKLANTLAEQLSEMD